MSQPNTWPAQPQQVTLGWTSPQRYFLNGLVAMLGATHKGLGLQTEAWRERQRSGTKSQAACDELSRLLLRSTGSHEAGLLSACPGMSANSTSALSAELSEFLFLIFKSQDWNRGCAAKVQKEKHLWRVYFQPNHPI